jgi:hypothetical protein
LVDSSAGILPPARNPNQISMILETLARCTKTSSTDLMAQLQRGTEIPWGTSCALFTRVGDRSAELVKAYLARRMLQVNLFSAEETLALCDGSSSGENSGSANGENKEMNIA